MKRLHIVVGSFALLAMCLVTEAQAQRGGGMMRMMRGGMQLDSAMLAMEAVQKELDLSEEQIEKIGKEAAKINEAMRSEMRELFQDAGGDRAEMEDAMKELMDELREEEKEIVALLNDDQKKRLQQLRYQRMGVAMYQDEAVQDALELSDSQKQDIDDAIDANQEALQDAMAEARDSGDFGSIRGTMTDLQKELAETLQGLLTDEQKEMVVDMKGEEFKFPERQNRRRQRSDF